MNFMEPGGRRQELWSLLGRLPQRDRTVTARMIAEGISPDGYRLQHLELELNGIEPVPAYLVLPSPSSTRESSSGLPAILYHHSHGGDYQMGKEELLLGRSYMHLPPFAVSLTQAGFAVLCIDCWNFGQRYSRTESSLFKEMLWRGQVLWGMMVYDAVRALDYLAGRDDVDAARIGTLGMSMGATLAWWLAALDDRIASCVDICCLTDFHALIESGGLDEHGIYYYVPDLLNHFTTADINALICPRPHLAIAGTRDPLTPLAGLQRIDLHLKEVYGAAGAAEAWKLELHDSGHQESPAMRTQCLAWLEKTLLA